MKPFAPRGSSFPGAIAAPLAMAALLGGCFGGEVSFLSNADALGDLASRLRIEVDPSYLELIQVELREDAVLFFYRGVAFQGDRAWVCRYSRKSTEQEPDSLTDIGSLETAIAEGRRGFAAEPPRRELRGKAVLSYANYRFDAPIRDPKGEPHRGLGIFGTLEHEIEGEPVIYYFNLDNWGDRPTLDVSALEPLLAAMLR